VLVRGEAATNVHQPAFFLLENRQDDSRQAKPVVWHSWNVKYGDPGPKIDKVGEKPHHFSMGIRGYCLTYL